MFPIDASLWCGIQIPHHFHYLNLSSKKYTLLPQILEIHITFTTKISLPKNTVFCPKSWKFTSLSLLKCAFPKIHSFAPNPGSEQPRFPSFHCDMMLSSSLPSPRDPWRSGHIWFMRQQFWSSSTMLAWSRWAIFWQVSKRWTLGNQIDCWLLLYKLGV